MWHGAYVKLICLVALLVEGASGASRFVRVMLCGGKGHKAVRSYGFVVQHCSLLHKGRNQVCVRM